MALFFLLNRKDGSCLFSSARYWPTSVSLMIWFSLICFSREYLLVHLLFAGQDVSDLLCGQSELLATETDDFLCSGRQVFVFVNPQDQFVGAALGGSGVVETRDVVRLAGRHYEHVACRLGSRVEAKDRDDAEVVVLVGERVVVAVWLLDDLFFELEDLAAKVDVFDHLVQGDVFASVERRDEVWRPHELSCQPLLLHEGKKRPGLVDEVVVLVEDEDDLGHSPLKVVQHALCFFELELERVEDRVEELFSLVKAWLLCYREDRSCSSLA